MANSSITILTEDPEWSCCFLMEHLARGVQKFDQSNGTFSVTTNRKIMGREHHMSERQLSSRGKIKDVAAFQTSTSGNALISIPYSPSNFGRHWSGFGSRHHGRLGGWSWSGLSCRTSGRHWCGWSCRSSCGVRSRLRCRLRRGRYASRGRRLRRSTAIGLPNLQPFSASAGGERFIQTLRHWINNSNLVLTSALSDHNIASTRADSHWSSSTAHDERLDIVLALVYNHVATNVIGFTTGYSGEESNVLFVTFVNLEEVLLMTRHGLTLAFGNATHTFVLVKLL